MFFIDNIFFTKIKKNSKSQLSLDFGEYPPNGIINQDVTTSFEEVSMRRHGHSYFIISKYLRSLKKKNNQQSIFNTYDDFSILEGIAEEAKEIVKPITNSNGIKKILNTILIVTIIFLISIPMFFYITYKVFGLIFRKSKSSKNFGYFLPITKGEYEIIINRHVINKAKKDIEPVISHEHIHMLQHFNKSSNNGFSLFDTSLKKPSLIFQECYQENKQLLYLADCNELEARLHELFLSFYRKHKFLPTSINDFYLMIISNHNLNKIFRDTDFYFGLKIKPENLYNIRDFQSERELEDIFLTMNSKDTMIKFLMEVISVMYGKLLEYYGDKEASLRFLAQIQGPTLYDRLYQGCPPIVNLANKRKNPEQP